jgi:hypothetical protein
MAYETRIKKPVSTKGSTSTAMTTPFGAAVEVGRIGCKVDLREG